jgi:hydroxymethylpyrimidine kinase/phosphomethylpyrimidine kinase
LGPSEVLTGVPTALTIAGSDSGGGAGIQADLKTFFALGVHGMSALTALTAQNTKGVTGVHPVPAEFVTQQIETVAADLPIGAAKTGMLATAEIVEAVARAVRDLQIKNLVVDPVFISKSRDRLLAEDAIDALKEKLFPAALVITPNLYEAGALLGQEVTTLDEMKSAAKALKDFGPAFVLVKGGHLAGEAIDVLYDGVAIIELNAERIDSPHTHGTGCILSAAITAYLAKGEPVVEAAGLAKSFVTGAIRHGLAIGGGFGPANPGWAISPGGAETS